MFMHLFHSFSAFLGPFAIALLSTLPAISSAALAQSNWQVEWEKTQRAAESEGQLTHYGCCYEFDRVLDGFKKRYPKIKVVSVTGSGGQLSSRILAERRGERYIPDVVSAGANTLHDALYMAQVLEPIKPVLILPEVLDQTKWYQGEHRYIDPEQRYIFAFVANSQSGQIIYNSKLVNPTEFKSYWDLLNPKWKGKSPPSIPPPPEWARPCSSFTTIRSWVRPFSKSSTGTCSSF